MTKTTHPYKDLLNKVLGKRRGKTKGRLTLTIEDPIEIHLGRNSRGQRN